MSKRLTKRSRMDRGITGSFVKQQPVGVGAFFIFVLLALGALLGVRLAPVSAVGGPFELVSHDNRIVSEKDFLGHPLLVFFGYTHCQDVCPLTLFEISEALRALGPDAKIGALFVTVDPERDTPEVLKDYLANFDPRIIGLSGDRAAVDRMLRSYHIYWRKIDGKGDDYSVDHTIVVYLMDKDGRLVRTFDVSLPPADAARELRWYF